MMDYSIKERVVDTSKEANKGTFAYILERTGTGKLCYYSLAELGKALRNHNVNLKNVRMTKTGKLRGCDGFLLSKVPRRSVDLFSIVETTQKIADYISRNMAYDYRCERCTMLNGNMVETIVTVRLPDYAEMDKEDAETELQEACDFHKEILFQKYTDRAYFIIAEVTDSGVVRLGVFKNIVDI